MKNWRARPSSRCKTLIMLWCSGKRKRKEKREGKGGKCFFLWRRRRPEHTFWRKVFGSCRRRQRAEKKKEENIWSAEEKKNREEKGGNYLVFGGEKETRWERRKLLEEGKILVTSIDKPPTTAGWTLSALPFRKLENRSKSFAILVCFTNKVWGLGFNNPNGISSNAMNVSACMKKLAYPCSTGWAPGTVMWWAVPLHCWPIDD